MRRALLVAAAIVPAAAHAAASAAVGQVLERNNYVVPVSYINAAQCSGGDVLRLEWNIQATATFTGTGSYRLFASNQAPYTSGQNQNYCAELSDTQANITAGPVGTSNSFPVTAQLQDADVSGLDAVSAASDSTTCTEGFILWICSHWYDASAVRSGYASGKFVVQITAPYAPSGVGVEEGDTRLKVSWTLNGSTPVQTDHYVARAFLPGDTTPVTTATTTGSSATLTGLTNGQIYEVDVVAYSLGGNNPSSSSPVPRLQATPSQTADFWTTYKDRGGQEQGGCAAGPGGGLSLLCAASLLALRRRRP